MTASSKVLSFPCTDGSQVLIQATSKGSNPLDLKIVGTEGNAAYRVTLKQDRVSSLRVKNCPVSEDEWEEILQALFQLRPPSDIQATASVEPEISISLTVRKIIQGTTHRLGSITLNYTESEEIGLFDWCVTAVDASLEGRKALSDVESQKDALEADIKDYKRQLDELIKAKDEDETVLLQKFRDLLNEKKLKIREQQKIISAASFTNPASSSPEPQGNTKLARKPAASRAGKRKATAKDAEDGDDTPSAEDMEVDNPIKVEEEETDPGNTTEGTASTAGDSDSDEGKMANPTSARAASPPPPPSTKKLDDPPPPRSLPFNQKKAAARSAPKPQSETDSDDDEL